MLPTFALPLASRATRSLESRTLDRRRSSNAVDAAWLEVACSLSTLLVRLSSNSGRRGGQGGPSCSWGPSIAFLLSSICRRWSGGPSSFKATLIGAAALFRGPPFTNGAALLSLTFLPSPISSIGTLLDWNSLVSPWHSCSGLGSLTPSQLDARRSGSSRSSLFSGPDERIIVTLGLTRVVTVQATPPIARTAFVDCAIGWTVVLEKKHLYPFASKFFLARRDTFRPAALLPKERRRVTPIIVSGSLGSRLVERGRESIVSSSPRLFLT
mmetsp:Transcript_33468/g.75602  ORF Transcript_33468/g.75602 Transcript_33468/m.75602 type:complete len:269 (-) Transcript_33468:42-848(-)